jgi:hypothetical protein
MISMQLINKNTGFLILGAKVREDGQKSENLDSKLKTIPQ